MRLQQSWRRRSFPCLAFLETAAKKAMEPFRTKEWNRGLNAVETVMKAAEEAPARKVAAAMAGSLAISIGFVELVVKLFG